MEVCQSCAMPLVKEADFGTEADGSVSKEYCVYCYKDGAFMQDVTMEQMIEHCSQFLDEFNKHAKEKITLDEAVKQMREYFPSLKRWSEK